MLEKIIKNSKITTQLNIAMLVIFIFALGNLIMVVLSVSRKDARVINQAGVVRGCTQRSIKLEFLFQPNDQLISKIDLLIKGLIEGDKELDLPKARDREFLQLMQDVKVHWGKIKPLISALRKTPESSEVQQELLTASEKLFELTNKAVVRAENVSNSRANTLKTFQFMIFALNLMILVVVFFVVRNITANLSQFTSNIASSSSQIASTVDEQERTMNIQASSVSQTTTTMDELGSSSLRVAEQAEASESGAHQVLNLAAQGTQSVEQAINGINTLKEQVNDIAKQILRLREQTGQIVNISQLVENIANKTNMLALNASVEAVRAGEQGKCFSVLAREIRKLADESKQSAEKINTLANEIKSSMNSTVMVTDQGTKRAIESISLVENMANAFTGVKEAINNVVVNSQQISLSVKQQAVSVQQVISVMNEINLGAQETASGITQIKTATEELKGASLTLQEAV